MKELLKFEEWHLPEGVSTHGLVVNARELLHVGLEGRRVERLTGESSESYILKQLPLEGVNTGESWAYAKVLPHLPVMYPRLIAQSKDRTQETPWLLFEDMGTIHHEVDESMLIQIAEWMALWHAVPLDPYPELSRSGQKPGYDAIVTDLSAKRSVISRLLKSLGYEKNEVNAFYDKLERLSFSDVEVYSHGDLHPGNYGRTSSGRIVVLDWEHNHRNSPLWDLYHMLDMSHPLYPRMPDVLIRDKVLDAYLEFSQAHGRLYDKEPFKKDYMLFAAAFSLWMLTLIDHDLQDPGSIWPQDSLRRQREETWKTIIDIIETF
ncbi:hypothetical protein BK126_16090 [Paenibacillus sp. FSL H7-0326]|uniref:phosphotransferase n=1 Tax=Paenibacillus sp. FSL H7-0326 TaxID=1921144 RepID=UPI00096E6018|nr:phosphotransferase [Paenibacillus sp. FSL H7-0326]OMC67141.1 hypothetical protein BK126_16090 [Paenibacillus sp. FSL H7-0326]